VLQEKEVRRVGDNIPVHVDVRVVAACNEPLEERVKDGQFREDLYYRLNVIPIQLPALRTRLDDIPLLVAHFLKQKGKQANGEPFKISRRAMEALLAHLWPGNVRELENAIERAVALCETATISLVDLPPSLLSKVDILPEEELHLEHAELPNVAETHPVMARVNGENSALTGTTTTATATRPLDSIKPLKNYLREQEQSYLTRVMEATNGDKEQAAIVLGVSLATLYRKLSGDD
jgi:DNA-binding NtrC family response regulator